MEQIPQEHPSRVDLVDAVDQLANAIADVEAIVAGGVPRPGTAMDRLARRRLDDATQACRDAWRAHGRDLGR